MVETKGWVGLVEATDAMCKAANVEIVKTIGSWGLKEGSGVADLVEAIDRHRARPDDRSVARAAAHLAELVRGLLQDRAVKALAALDIALQVKPIIGRAHAGQGIEMGEARPPVRQRQIGVDADEARALVGSGHRGLGQHLADVPGLAVVRLLGRLPDLFLAGMVEVAGR